MKGKIDFNRLTWTMEYGFLIEKIPNKSLTIPKTTSEKSKLSKGLEPIPTCHFKILRKDKIALILKHKLREEGGC